MFHAVEFLGHKEGTLKSARCLIDVVPVSWVTNNKICFWLPQKEDRLLQVAVVTQAPPDVKTWSKHEISVLFTCREYPLSISD